MKRQSSPTGWRAIWAWWKRIARRIADVQVRLMLAIFYFLIVAPFALAIRWGSDPLAIKAGAPRGWRRRDEEPGTPLERAARQS